MKGQFKVHLTILCVYVSVFQVSGIKTSYNKTTGWKTYFSGEELKYPQLLMDDVQKLYNLVTANKNDDSLSPKFSKKMLIVFLHSGYFNVDEAYKIIVNNIHYGSKLELCFFKKKNLSMDEMNSVFTNVSISIVPVPYENKDDRHIYMQLKRTQTMYFNFEWISQYFLMLIKFLLSTNGTFEGLVVTINVDGLGFTHMLFRIKFRFLYILIQFLQTGLPIRLKAIHIVNAEVITSMFTMFMSQKVKDKIYRYKSEQTKDVFNHVPVKYMPREIGGEGKSHYDYSEETNNQMLLFFYPSDLVDSTSSSNTSTSIEN